MAKPKQIMHQQIDFGLVEGQVVRKEIERMELPILLYEIPAGRKMSVTIVIDTIEEDV